MSASYVIRSNAIFDGVQKTPYAGAVVVEGNKIAKVIAGGDGAEFIGPDTKVLDYGDKMVMAGFVDAHDHFFDGTVTASDHMCSILASTNEAEAVEMMKEYRKTHPDEVRIRAMGWMPTIWNNAPLPTKKSLDEAFPDIPVYAITADFHTFWCNTLALEESGYTPEDTFEGGFLGKFEDGSLNGLVHEPAAFLKAKYKVFEFDLEGKKENMRNFIQQTSAAGVTAVSDMSASDFAGGEDTPLEAALDMIKRDELNVRIHLYNDMNSYEDFTPVKEFADKIKSDFVQMPGVKAFYDGTTATHTAWMIEPYEDRPATVGEGCPVAPVEDMNRRAAAANAAGLAVRIHCIGDQAVRSGLDCFEESIKKNGKHGLKNTIEHIEIIDPADIPRFAELDVIASMQPQHLPLDEFEKSTRCGEERASLQWAHRSILDAGAKMAFGTDYPVVDFNPYPTIHSAVTRCFGNGEPCSTNPEQCITLYESLYAYTMGAADVYSRTDEIGSLEEGKLADIIAVDRNLFAIDPQDIFDAKTIMTMIDGRIVYEA